MENTAHRIWGIISLKGDQFICRNLFGERILNARILGEENAIPVPVPKHDIIA